MPFLQQDVPGLKKEIFFWIVFKRGNKDFVKGQAMVDLDVMQFIRQGYFNEINFFCSREELIDKCGKTIYTIGKKIPSIYKYEMLEFYFQGKDNRLFGVEILFQVSYEKNKNVKVDYSWINEKINFDGFSKKLKTEGIEFIKYIDEEGFPVIKINNGILIYFSQIKGHRIDKIIKFIDLPVIPDKDRQINFSLPNALFEIVKKEALKNKISVSKTCRNIIMDYLKKNKSSVDK
jgi:hypothetical protein